MKIAVFGSAFNPPSLGHKSVIESLSHFDRILLLPSIAHAWGKEMLDYALRTQLVDAFIVDLNMTNVERCTIEEILLDRAQSSVTTYAVLEALQVENPTAELTFVIGPDNFFNFAKFHNAQEIVRRWSVMACPEKVKIRSTDIRTLLADGQKINHLTTPNVCAMLVENNYY
ncbi:nicotinic acid mononucleotide adenylyltransferase [Vibrio sp. N418]|uniref:nicotinate-nicotinamide nucleotide adenylyltransferase n=1 Tax=Vibrio sp. (strain N418) TaxID=701176 RepID=UPI00021BDF09|nr:nicotinate-nicotinamide nucleotide adenylyltransferase [Vibrio sp. N418]EGU35161.1 nicotinic acid mononucleotide adenylyltransferase [Vibrio sp. N418]